MTGLTLRGMVGGVADEDEYKIDDKEYPCHPDAN